jgi:hypothetical protein
LPSFLPLERVRWPEACPPIADGSPPRLCNLLTGGYPRRTQLFTAFREKAGDVLTAGQEGGAMIGMPESVRSLCLAYDLQAYSSHGVRQQLSIQEQLSRLLHGVFTEAGLREDSYRVQPQGDGGVALLPTGKGVDEPRMLVTMIKAFEIGLAENNEQLLPDRRLRLRLALAQGVVIHDAAHGFVGGAVVHACRIRDSAAIRQALASTTGYLVVAVTHELYQDVFADGPYGLPGAAFSRVVLDSGNAWIFVPGTSAATTNPASKPGNAAGQATTGSVKRPDQVMVQDNHVTGRGVLFGTQGGSIYVDARNATGDSTPRTPDQSAGPPAGDLAALAKDAAATLTAAMGTREWTGVRDAIARIFRRADEKRYRGIDDRLDEDTSLVAASDDQAEARTLVRGPWQLRLRELLMSAPDVATELAEVIRASGPATKFTDPAQTEQRNTVRDYGRAFIAQGGDVIMHPDAARREIGPSASDRDGS